MEFTWRMVGTLIWPVVVAVVLIAYYPWITKRLGTFRVKAGGVEAEVSVLDDKADKIGQDLSPSLWKMREPITEDEVPTTLVDLIPVINKNRSEGLHAAFDLVVRAVKEHYPPLERVPPSQLKQAMQDLVADRGMEPDVAASVWQLQEFLEMPEWNEDKAGDTRGYAFLMLAEGAIHEILRTAQHRALAAGGDGSLARLVRPSWRGTYDNRFPLELRVLGWNGTDFTATITYPNEGTVTSVSGQAEGTTAGSGARLSWRETGYVLTGRRAIDRNGYYTATVTGDEMVAEWHGRQVDIAFKMSARDESGAA